MHLKSSNDRIPAFGFNFSKTEIPAVLGLWTVAWILLGLRAFVVDEVGVIDLREVVCVVFGLLTIDLEGVRGVILREVVRVVLGLLTDDLDGVGVYALLEVGLIGGLVIVLKRCLLRAM